MSGGGSKGSSSSSSRVRIPAYLRPLIDQGVATGTTSLQTLEGMIQGASGSDLVPDFNPIQLLSQGLGIDRALGGGGFIPTAQDTFLNAAQGTDLSQYIPESALNTLNNPNSGMSSDLMARFGAFSPDMSGFDGLRGSGVDPAAMQALRPGYSADTGQLQSILNSGVDSAALQALAGQSGVDPSIVSNLMALSGQGASTNDLRSLYDVGAVPDSARAALESTAAGDYLYGGQGFNEAVQAAVRAATPSILSTFGAAGAGGGTGALAHAAIGKAATDAFAGQYGQERQRQLAASQALADLGLTERGQSANIANQIAGIDLQNQSQGAGILSQLADIGLSDQGQQAGIAQALANLGLSERGQDVSAAETIAGLGLDANAQNINAANLLGQLGLADQGQQAGIAETLASLGLETNQQNTNSAAALAQLLQGQDDRALDAASLLSALGTGERQNQLTAAQALPQIGLADVNLLNMIGGDIYDLEAQQRLAPINAQLQLLQAAMGGVPIESLLGRKTSGRESGFQLSFGG